MNKFHLSSDGQARPCKAEYNCPLGAGTPHVEFESQKEANQWAEKMLAEEFVGKELRGETRKKNFVVTPQGRLRPGGMPGGPFQLFGSALEAAYHRDTGREAVYSQEDPAVLEARYPKWVGELPEQADEGQIYFIDQKGKLKMKDFERENAILGRSSQGSTEFIYDKKAQYAALVTSRSTAQRIREFPFKPFTSKSEALAWAEKTKNGPVPAEKASEETNETPAAENVRFIDLARDFSREDAANTPVKNVSGSWARRLFSRD